MNINITFVGYRIPYPILTGKVALRVRELIPQIAADNEIEIISGIISSDHIHIYVSIPSSLSGSKLVQFLKSLLHLLVNTTVLVGLLGSPVFNYLLLLHAVLP
jgi:REP element-mobilizing transposase RayT